MRYKALSPFVRGSHAPEPPARPPQQPASRAIAILVTVLMVIAPVAFAFSDAGLFSPVAAGNNGHGRPSDRANRSAPPGQAKKSPTPTSAPTLQPTTDPTPEPTLAPATPPPATPAPTAAPSTAYGDHCASASSPAPYGWHRVVADSFNQDIPLGEWGRVGGAFEFPGGIWRARTAGWKDSSGRGTYDSPRTTTQHDGLLDVWVHSEGSTRYVAAPIPLVGDTVGQRISLCMRADEIPGYKLAFLLWPSEGPGNYHGEVNLPELRLVSGRTAHGFMHYDPKPSSGQTQDAYDSDASVQSWHVFTMEWHPRADYVAFYVDGRLFGRSSGDEVPDGPMHYVMQVETYMAGEELPPPAEGHVLVDWFTIDVPA